MLEYVIRTMENSLAPHFSTICNLLVEGFQYHPQPRFLSTAGVFAGNFGSMGDSYVKPLAQLLQRMSNNTFLSLQSSIFFFFFFFSKNYNFFFFFFFLVDNLN